jgi:hypothetical protein
MVTAAVLSRLNPRIVAIRSFTPEGPARSDCSSTSTLATWCWPAVLVPHGHTTWWPLADRLLNRLHRARGHRAYRRRREGLTVPTICPKSVRQPSDDQNRSPDSRQSTGTHTFSSNAESAIDHTRFISRGRNPRSHAFCRGSRQRMAAARAQPGRLERRRFRPFAGIVLPPLAWNQPIPAILVGTRLG